jgi:hypothetical protein
LILSIVPERGPGPDFTHFHRAFDQARRRIRFTTLAADAGYDAEHIHQLRPRTQSTHAHSTAHWPTYNQATPWLLETDDEAHPAAFTVWPAMASGNH